MTELTAEAMEPKTNLLVVYGESDLLAFRRTEDATLVVATIASNRTYTGTAVEKSRRASSR